MRHAPTDSSRFIIARDKQLRFVGIAGFFPDALLVWIAPSEHIFDGIERRYRVVRMPSRKSRGETVIAGRRVVENGGFGNAFGHNSNFTAPAY